MTYINSFDKTKIFYKYQKGKYDTLVFLHGIGGNWTVWKKEINYFKKLGFSILYLDLRGHGLSEAPFEFEKYKMQAFSKDIRKILKKEKISKYYLIGHSLGGAIAINYCVKYKTKIPQGLVLIETASTYPYSHNRLLNMSPYITNILRFIANHKPTRKHQIFDPKNMKEVDLSYTGLKENIHLISYLAHLTPIRAIVKTLDNIEQYVFKSQKDIDNTLRNLTIPNLVIGGKKDTVVPVKYSKLIKKLDKRAKLKILPGADHRVIINDPSEIEEIMYFFLKHKTNKRKFVEELNIHKKTKKKQ